MDDQALTDLREATRIDLIFLQGCDEDWKRQPFGTVLIRTPTVSGGCDDDVPDDDGGSGGGAAADADADAGTPRRDPASDAGESGAIHLFGPLFRRSTFFFLVRKPISKRAH